MEGQEPNVNPPAGQEPAGPGGQEPDKSTTVAPDTGDKGQEPKSPEPDWIKDLRQENAKQRKALQAAETRLQEFEDRDKTEQQKLADRAEAAERKATEAEGKLLRVAVAAKKKMTADWVERLRGDTLEELEQDADRLLEQIAEQYQQPPTRTSAFDGGARQRSAEKRSPEEEHNDFLLGVLGRKRTP